MHNIQRWHRLDPFGMRQDRILEWQQLIRGILVRSFKRGMAASGWMSMEEFGLHETLLGITHAQHRSLNLENAKRLYEEPQVIITSAN